jgi:hypothetical protein
VKVTVWVFVAVGVLEGVHVFDGVYVCVNVGVWVGVRVGVAVGVKVAVLVGVLLGVGVYAMELHDALKPGKVMLELLVQRRNILPDKAVSGEGGVLPDRAPSKIPVASVPSYTLRISRLDSVSNSEKERVIMLPPPPGWIRKVQASLFR